MLLAVDASPCGSGMADLPASGRRLPFAASFGALPPRATVGVCDGGAGGPLRATTGNPMWGAPPGPPTGGHVRYVYQTSRRRRKGYLDVGVSQVARQTAIWNAVESPSQWLGPTVRRRRRAVEVEQRCCSLSATPGQRRGGAVTGGGLPVLYGLLSRVGLVRRPYTTEGGRRERRMAMLAMLALLATHLETLRQPGSATRTWVLTPSQDSVRRRPWPEYLGHDRSLADGDGRGRGRGRGRVRRRSGAKGKERRGTGAHCIPSHLAAAIRLDRMSDPIIPPCSDTPILLGDR